MQRNSATMVIVGAGIAGLSAAHQLLQAGFSDVTILEGSDRVGGRIKSVSPCDGEGVVELGATCIHGASPENPIYKLANEWGIADSMVPIDRIDGQYYQENGKIIDKSIVEETWKLYKDMESDMKTIFQAKDKTHENADPISVAQYVQRVKPNLLQHFPEGEKREGAAKVFNTFLNFCQFINGDELDLLSADLLGKYKEIAGPELMFIGEGYSGFIKRLLAKIPDSHIHLTMEVIQISWSGNKAEIICKNGSHFKADHVIITCPLGHLKATHKQMFKPHLPEAKTNAIENIGFGHVAKLFLYYDQPFWENGIQLAWASHGKKPLGRADWVRDLVTFGKVPTNRKVLGGPFGGKGAEILETLSDEEVSTTCSNLLREFLQDPSVPKPSMVLRSNWNSDPLYRGTYSYQSTKCHEYDVHNLAAPLPDESQPVLLFAGEATHPDYYSTVHGAYLSGVREGQRLIEQYKA